MKAFTSLMKIAIAIVSITLTVMLVMQVYPLVSGGIDVQNEEDLSITLNGTKLEITGTYNVVSTIKQDISNLTIEAYVASHDGNQRKNLVTIDPFTINPDNPSKLIVIDESIPIAELMVFFITDNMAKDGPGMVLPITIAISGSYSNNLAGIDMEMTYNVPISNTATIGLDETKYHETSDGELQSVGIKIGDIGLEGLLPDIGDVEGTFTFNFGGHELNFEAGLIGGDIGVGLFTGDPEASIQDEIQAILDILTEGADADLTLEFNGEVITFNPGDLMKENLDESERIRITECMEQVEGICESLYEFLDMFAAMNDGGA